jgi:hypothetical protein
MGGVLFCLGSADFLGFLYTLLLPLLSYILTLL